MIGCLPLLNKGETEMVRSTTMTKIWSSIVRDILKGINKSRQQLDKVLKMANRKINVTSRVSVQSIKNSAEASEHTDITVIKNDRSIIAKNDGAYGLKIKLDKILVRLGNKLNHNKHTITNIPGIKICIDNKTEDRVYWYK